MTEITIYDMLPLADGKLIINEDSAPGGVLADLLVRCTNGAPIQIREAIRVAENGAVTVNGKTDFLNVANMPFTAFAAPGPTGTPAVTLRFSLIEGAPGPNAWYFSRSFPDLPNFFGANTSRKSPGEAGEAHVMRTLLDTLTLSDAAFVITTGEGGSDPVTGAPLRPGLNFVSRCMPTGLLGLLGSILTGGGEILLHGPIVIPKLTELTLPIPSLPLLRYPWQLPEPPPGLNLVADLDVDKRIGNALRLHSVKLRIYSPITKDWAAANPTYTPTLAASANLDAPSAGMSLDISAIGVDHPDDLTLFGLFEGVSVGKIADLIDVTGVDDLAASLPDDVRNALDTMERLSLESITLELGGGLSVRGVGVIVGLPDLNTHALPGFMVESLLAGFSIEDPFGPGRSLSVRLGGGMRFLDAPFDVDITLPEVAAVAVLKDDVSLPLERAFSNVGLPAPPDLTINQMQIEADKSGNLSFATLMAQSPPWTLDLGPAPLTVSDVVALTDRPAGGAASGSLGGVLSLGDDLKLAVAYQTPGDFIMRGELPDVRLLQLIGKLSNQPLALPGNFDLALADNVVLIQKAESNLVFQLATTMENLGTVAFEARRVSGAQNTWGFAAGIALTGLGLSNLPGLESLKMFEEVFRLDQLLVVVSSFEDPGFKFPSLAAFNSPIIRAGDLKLPAQAGGVIQGFNVHARWTLDTVSREQELLRKLLELNPSLGVTLQVGITPSQNSRLYVSYDTTIQGLPFSCKFGGQISGGQVGLFLTGALQARIQGQLARFDTTLLFVTGGAFISGSMRGSITFEGLTLSNLALVIGVNWGGVPSLGIAATLMSGRFQSSLAIFFDSADPSRSLLAGAVSELSLRDVLDNFAGRVAPSEVDAALREVELVGTSEFTIGAELAAALDNLQVDTVSAAFAKQGVSLPSDSSQVLLNVSRRGRTWFLTDMSKMLYYELAKTDSGIRVTLNPQFYCAPQTTFIGALRFDQGIFINAGLKILSFGATAKVLVKPAQGISVDGAMDRIVIGTEALFSVQSNDGKRGPHISAATFDQPGMPDPALKRPHFLINGSLNLLGLKQSVYVKVNASEFSFELKGALTPGFNYDLKGRFRKPTDLGVGGLLNVGVGVIDLGSLGKANINTGVSGSFDAGVAGSKIWAKFAGGFEFAGSKLILPNVDLDVHTASLPELPKKVSGLVAESLKTSLKDAAKWLNLVRTGVITGVSNVGATLKTTYGVAAQQAAQLLKGAGYAAGEVGAVLKTTYGATTDQAAQLLKVAGYAVNDIGNALKTAYAATAQQASQSLKAAGYTADQVGAVLKTAYGATAQQAAQLLKGAGYTADQAGIALKSAYGATADQMTLWLKGAGYAINEVGAALKIAYGATSQQTAQLLKGAGYTADQVGNTLKTVYGVTAGQAAQLLKGAGYAVNDVGNAIKVGWGASADVVAGALKEAGYAVNEVGGYVKAAFNLGPEQLKNALQGAGFPMDQIKGFFDSLGGAFSDFFSDVGKALDPTKW